MMFSIPYTESVAISKEVREHMRVYCHDTIITNTIKRSKTESAQRTFLKVVVGMLILERLKDVLQSDVKHPLTDFLRENLTQPYETYRINLAWLTCMILGNLANTPEYQILSVSFAIQPLYFELLDTYYNFGNSRYVINESVDILSKDESFLRHLVENLEAYR